MKTLFGICHSGPDATAIWYRTRRRRNAERESLREKRLLMGWSPATCLAGVHILERRVDSPAGKKWLQALRDGSSFPRERLADDELYVRPRQDRAHAVYRADVYTGLYLTHEGYRWFVRHERAIGPPARLSWRDGYPTRTAALSSLETGGTP